MKIDGKIHTKVGVDTFDAYCGATHEIINKLLKQNEDVVVKFRTCSARVGGMYGFIYSDGHVTANTEDCRRVILGEDFPEFDKIKLLLESLEIAMDVCE